jgi:dipeptidyl aminopeptidase/acylaminoacyl peptidase
MGRPFRAAVALLLVTLVSPPTPAAPLAIADALKPPSMFWMQLSPDGKNLLAVGQSATAFAVMVIDVDSLTPRLVHVTPLRWPPIARWLDRGSIVVGANWQTQVLDLDGKVLRTVDGEFRRIVVPDRQGHRRILVRSPSTRTGIDRVDLTTGAAERVNFEQPGNVVQWVFDRDGIPRVATTRDTPRWSKDTTVTQWYRKSLADPWKALDTAQYLQQTWSPLYLSADERSLVVVSSQGRDTRAAFRYSLDDRRLTDMLAGHPTQDIARLEGGRDQQQVDTDVNPDANVDVDGGADAGAGYQRVVTIGIKPEIFWFEPKRAALQKSVDAALPGRINWLTGGGGGRVLVYSYADIDPGTWYVLDIATSNLKEIARAQPEIDPKAMRPQRIVSYPSLDGLSIPAYLTLPADGLAKGLPAVVLVHGGPIVRDVWGFDPEVQMLASRGFAVLQPQFRGSVGFGEAFTSAGYGQWGAAMQDDVTAGAQWLVAQGIADPARMCIYGASYGGYAASWALVKTPDLFRCGVSLAGVSDLAYMLKDDSDTNDTATGRLTMRLYAGDALTDRVHADAVSPLLHADAIKAPLLLAHGTRDGRVPIDHSEKLLDAMRANKKSVEWIKLPGEGHGIGQPENQQRYYRALFAFLGKHTRTAMPDEDAVAAASAAASSAPASAPR